MKYYRFLTEVLIPIVKTEFQLLYVYHLVGPFLQRFQQERTRCMLEVGGHADTHTVHTQIVAMFRFCKRMGQKISELGKSPFSEGRFWANVQNCFYKLPSRIDLVKRYLYSFTGISAELFFLWWASAVSASLIKLNTVIS